MNSGGLKIGIWTLFQNIPYDLQDYVTKKKIYG